MTCVPLLEHLHPELLQHLPAIKSLADELVASKQDVEGVKARMSKAQAAAYEWLWTGALTDSAYDIPFLSSKFCDQLLLEAEDMAVEVGHAPNPDEDEAYQIPELVLHDVCLQMHASLNVLKQRVIDPASLVLYGFAAEHIRSIQFARYEAARTGKGNWHSDLDSDVTAVVSLAPELYKGGGTQLRTRLAVETVPPLSKGHMLLFLGKSTIHRGMPVESGCRDLLVFWSEVK